MVYLVKLDNYYKIGYSENPIKRVKAFRSTHNIVEIIAVRMGNTSEEKMLHKACKEFHIKNELFELCEDVEVIFKTLVFDDILSSTQIRYKKLQFMKDKIKLAIPIHLEFKRIGCEKLFMTDYDFRKYTILTNNGYVLNEELFQKEEKNLKIKFEKESSYISVKKENISLLKEVEETQIIISLLQSLPKDNINYDQLFQNGIELVQEKIKRAQQLESELTLYIETLINDKNNI